MQPLGGSLPNYRNWSGKRLPLYQRSYAMSVAVQMKNIVKLFGAVRANDDVCLTIQKNSIHGIIGENGAGKTTLMKILYGMYRPDGGEILLDGKRVKFSSPKDAIACHIGMVHQHFTLVPSMTVMENIILGCPPQKRGFIDRKKALEQVNALCEKYNFNMDPNAVISELPVGLRQRVEILNALFLGADILIMDEPTAVLTPQEITGLFETLKELRNHGASIILITHKLSEVMAITDEVTVLRDGKVTGRVHTSDTNERALAQMMVGRGVLLNVEKAPAQLGDTVLRMEHIRSCNDDGLLTVDDVSFSLREGEIVGIAGVQGNGQSELIEILSGVNQDYVGAITIAGKLIPRESTPWARRKAGLGLIPEDRQISGSAGVATVEDNFLMTTYRKRNINKHGFISRKIARMELEASIEAFKIKIPSIKAGGYSLSGGNMQKLIVAREYNLHPKILIAAQPTRGVDIGAMEIIHKKLVELRESGKAVLLVSNELSEIMSLSDRILVMYQGRIMGEVAAKDAEESQLGLWMAGISEMLDSENSELM